MSAVEDKSSNNDEENESITPNTSKKTTEGNITYSDTDAEISGSFAGKTLLSVTDITPEGSSKAAGDVTLNISSETTEKPVKLPEMSEEISKTDSGIGSGDSKAKDDAIDPATITSKSDTNLKVSTSDKSLLEDDTSNIVEDDDDNLELKWDDDEEDEVMTDVKDKPTEVQVLEGKVTAESTDIVNKEATPKVLETSEDSLGDVTLGEEKEDLDVSAEEERLLLEESNEENTMEKGVEEKSESSDKLKEIAALIEDIQKKTLEFSQIFPISSSKISDKPAAAKDSQNEDKTLQQDIILKESETPMDVNETENPNNDDKIEICPNEPIKLTENISNEKADVTDNITVEKTLQETEQIETDMAVSSIINEKELLEEPETMVESKLDESMDVVEKENEKELLRSMSNQEDSSDAMDVDADVSLKVPDDASAEDIVDKSDNSTKTTLEFDKMEVVETNTSEKRITRVENIDTNSELSAKDSKNNHELEPSSNLKGSKKPTAINENIASENSPELSLTASSNENEADISIDIKTDHGVKKPDVMIEIPTQELIDIDDVDLSFNPDDFASPNKDQDEGIENSSKEHAVSEECEMPNKDQNIKEVAIVEKNLEEVLSSEKVGQEKKSVEEITGVKIEKERPDTIEETMEKMFAEDDEAVKYVPISTASTRQESNQPSTNKQVELSTTLSKPEYQKLDISSQSDIPITQKPAIPLISNQLDTQQTDIPSMQESAVSLNTPDISPDNESTTEQMDISSNKTGIPSTEIPEPVSEENKNILSKDIDSTMAIEDPDNTINEPAVPSTSEPAVPSSSEPAVPSAAEATVPSTNESTVPSTNESAVPSTTESAVPSTSEPAIPSTSEPDVPSTSEPAVPSTSEPTVLSTSELAVPSTSELAVPSTSEPAVPSTSEPTVLSTSEPAVPSTSELPVPSATEPAVPSTSEPAARSTSQPATSSTSEPAVPSTSVKPDVINAMTPDTSDEVPEISDSLGLLAESSARMMDDDDDDNDDQDDDDDFDQDESSNQISAEQSEDSNPVPSDTEAGLQKGDQTPEENNQFEFNFNGESNEGKESKEGVDMDVDEGEIPEIQSEEVSMDVEENTNTSAFDELLKDKEEPAVAKEADKESDVETVKLSDTSDNEVEDKQAQKKAEEVAKVAEETKKDVEEQKSSPAKQSPVKPIEESPSPSKQSPSKLQKLAVASIQNNQVYNIVELEESSSSEDDIQEIKKQPETEPSKDKSPPPDSENVTKVNIPSGIEVMTCASGGNTSELTTKEGEVVISVPKPPPQKPARLNTDEVSIKTVSNAEPLVIPEAKMKEEPSLETFNLDSDEEDNANKEQSDTKSPHKMTPLELEKARETSKCINYSCSSGSKDIYRVADAATVAYYDAGRKRRAMVCQTCAEVVAERTKNLIQGIKNMTPLLELEMSKRSEDLVEISDSDSEEEDNSPDEPKETIGEKGAKFLEDNLSKLLNEAWIKYDLDTRLKDTQSYIDEEIEKLEKESQEINKMLDDCQQATDKLRCDLYATFECRRQELPAITIFDVYGQKFHVEPELKIPPVSPDIMESRLAKRLLSGASEPPAKRPAIPLGYTPLDHDKKEPAAPVASDLKQDDDKDISVVRLSAESAPADLPPPGLISRPPLRVNMPVYAMKNAFGPWLKGKILEIQPKNPNAGINFAMCRVKFDHKAKNNGKVLPSRCVAYAEPADVRMTIGTRLIALFKDSNKRESYYSGVVAEIPNPVNNYRYLVFFDDGYAQYVDHRDTRLVCDSSLLVWEEVHPFSREFVRKYLMAYPERPMVRLHEGQHLKTEWNGKWWSSRVEKVDASLAQVVFLGDERKEWIYRGSTRLAPLYLELRAAEKHRLRPMPRSKAQPRSNMPYVEYTRSEEQESKPQDEPQTQTQREQNEEIRRQRAVAKKSTTPVQPTQPTQHAGADTVTSRVVYYTPKNAVRPYKMVPHKCGPQCKRTDVLTLKELRTYNPLAKPLLSGWERQIVRYKGHKEVMYRAPCGRRVRNLPELHAYLRATDSELPVDLFDFHPGTHCLAEFVLNKCLVGKKDLSHGKENVPVPCVNYIDDSLPEFCSYNTERTPTAGVPLNLDPEFLCGCDCTDDCVDKSKCACWKMTLEGARTIGLEGPNVGYSYKRLPEPLPSGIYECNSRCKCKNTCLNRVAQHPLQLKLQVFKTLNRGWGIRALNDVPKGSFLCVYAGNLLTDATANLDGLNEGDEYLAELDYIEVVEQMKEGFEEDIPEADKKLDRKELAKKENVEEEEEESEVSEEEETASKSDKEDDDFRPGYIGLGVMEFNKRLRKRDKKDKKDKNKTAAEKEKEKEREPKGDGEEDCITISDDEEVREPSRFTAQDNMGANDFVSKYKSVRSLFGKDEACYIMDAKVQGNIGRYLNHSCRPNVFVQNVFVDTHDPRFPWVAFFALSHIKAGTELTWNYNYDVGSVPGKVLYCFCGAPNCRGRLL